MNDLPADRVGGIKNEGNAHGFDKPGDFDQAVMFNKRNTQSGQAHKTGGREYPDKYGQISQLGSSEPVADGRDGLGGGGAGQDLAQRLQLH